MGLSHPTNLSILHRDVKIQTMPDLERVEFGFRRDIEGAHQSEAIILYSTYGSIMGIDTGSNIWNLASEHEGLKPEDLHVDFNLQWVPPPN